MSVRLMGMCFEVPLEPQSKLLLLALADHANHSGQGVYPGNRRLARKVSLQVRQTQNLLSHLERHGLIKRERYAAGGRGHAVEWSINVPLLAYLESVQSDAPLSVNHAPCAIKGCNLSLETMQPIAPQPSVTDITAIVFNSEAEETPRLPGESPTAYFKRLAELGT